MEDEIIEHGLIKELWKAAREDAWFIVGGGSSLLAAVGVSSGLQAALHAAMIAAVGSAATVGWKGIGSARSAGRSVRREDLYYLVQINRGLSR